MKIPLTIHKKEDIGKKGWISYESGNLWDGLS